MKNAIKNQETFVLALSCLVLGVLTGLSSGLLSIFLEFVERLFLSFSESASFPASLNISDFHRLFSVLIGGCIVGVVWYVLRTKFSSVSSVTKAIDGENMPTGQTIVHVLAQIFYVGTGGSVGRELAPREAGTLIAQKWEYLLHRTHLASLTKEDRQLLLAAAAGAGFAGVYIAPITGMLFCVEILLKKVSLRTISVSLVMSIISMLVGAIFKGFDPYYLVGDVKFSLPLLFIGVVIAPLCGIMGAFFRKAVIWAEKNQTKNKNILWQLPIIALLTGLIAMKFPQIMGNGRALAQLSMEAGEKLIPILLIGMVLKAIITLFTIRAGAAGGTLTPAIAVGASIGALIGLAFSMVFPTLSIAHCALLGAVALLAASQQAPLMAMFMLIEISHLDFTAFAPLGLVAALSVVFSRFILGKKEK